MTAIEADRIEDLPAMVYLKPFLKSLSRILQIDPSQVVERYLNALGLSRPGR
jgi:cytoskeletal protein RodZ